MAPLLQGLWRLSDGGWTWLAHGTDAWDWWHRQIDQAFGGRQVDGPPEGAPLLPGAVPKTVKEDRDGLGDWAESDALKAWVGTGRSAWVVLQEDLYESRFGDGVFHDLVACVATKAEAEAVPISGERHMRRVDFTVVAGSIVARAERPSSADRYRLQESVGLLLGG